MPVSRWDGVSGAMNCLLLVLSFLAVMELGPFIAVQADTPALPTRTEAAASSGCGRSAPLPSAIAPYVHFAEGCLLSPDSDITFLEGDVLVMFHRLNELRERNGLQPLIWHPGAAEAARLHGVDMMRRDYFDHHSPEGLTGKDRLRRIDRDEVFSVSGENLAWYSNSWPDGYTSQTLQAQLEGSPSHLESMLNPEYTHAGAAIIKQGFTYIAVQVFISSEGQLQYDWPEVLHSGDHFELPQTLGSRDISGWRLTSEDGALVARAYDHDVVVPETNASQLNLVILGAESRTQYLLLNGPAADLN